MNRSIRAVAIGTVLAIGVVALATVWHQALAGPGYRTDLRNPRRLATFEDRGEILTSDGVVVADSVDVDGSARRVYPEASLFAHPVGHAAGLFGATGVEGSNDGVLRTPAPGALESVLGRVFGNPPAAADVITTLDARLQAVAADALGDQRGAVVLLDAVRGDVLAWVSSPTYDPNVLTGPEALAAGAALNADEARPLVDRARLERYAPGSVFKVVVAAAALEAGLTPDSLLEDAAEYVAPGTETPIRNAVEGPCLSGDTITLAEALVVSCNTAFASLGVELGAAAVTSAATDTGFGDVPPMELDAIPSVIPPAADLAADVPALAQSAIGGRDVRATPVQMALLAAAVATDGTAPRPRFVADVVEGGSARAAEPPREWRRMVSAAVAADLRTMMIDVVERGTGTAAGIPGVVVGGKTGTARQPDAAPHTWFIGFADHDGATVAVAVVVENGGALGDEGTGGRVAAPIAHDLLTAWVEGRR